MERDVFTNLDNRTIFISTHTLTWSVTTAEQITIHEIKISTHTLTWSVTNWYTAKVNRVQISTHTLTWSVTAFMYEFSMSLDDFNSHAHVERDTMVI